MKTVRIVSICVLVSGILAGQLYGEIVSVDMATLPECKIDTTLSVETTLGSSSDSDTTTVTGNITAELDIFFDAGIPEVADVNSIQFTGGQLHFSDMSYTIDFYIFGTMNATSTGLVGSLDSPYGPGAVVDEKFDLMNHVLMLNRGEFYALGTDFIGDLFDPMTFEFIDEPMVLSLVDTGSVSVALESLEDNEATYSVTLILPIDYEELLFEFEFESGRVDFAGISVVEAQGFFVRCPLRADLAGEDCWVDEADLAVFADQWLAFGDVNDCGLSADLYGEDCYVDVCDFAVVASEWLSNVISND